MYLLSYLVLIFHIFFFRWAPNHPMLPPPLLYFGLNNMYTDVSVFEYIPIFIILPYPILSSLDYCISCIILLRICFISISPVSSYLYSGSHRYDAVSLAANSSAHLRRRLHHMRAPRSYSFLFCATELHELAALPSVRRDRRGAAHGGEGRNTHM